MVTPPIEVDARPTSNWYALTHDAGRPIAAMVREEYISLYPGEVVQLVTGADAPTLTGHALYVKRVHDADIEEARRRARYDDYVGEQLAQRQRHVDAAAKKAADAEKRRSPVIRQNFLPDGSNYGQPLAPSGEAVTGAWARIREARDAAGEEWDAKHRILTFIEWGRRHG